MTDNKDATHASSTVGGMLGHVLRRLLHLSIILIPLIYYSFINSKFVVVIILIAVAAFEWWRIYNMKV